MYQFRLSLQLIRSTYSQVTKTSKLLVVSAAVAAISAYSPATEATNNSVQASGNRKLLPQASFFPKNQETSQPVKLAVTIPGISNPKQISFKNPSKGVVVGVFEAVNNGAELSNTITKTKPFLVSGWAVSSDKKKPASSVIITSGEANTPVAVAVVNLNRPDVSKFLKNPSLTKSGWVTRIVPSSLSGQKVTLKAWSYDPQTKTAIMLGTTHQIILQ